VSGLELTLEPKREVRRFEVINGACGRRRWAADDKARIITETLEPGAVMSEVARRHGLLPLQLFGLWTIDLLQLRWRYVRHTSWKALGRPAPASVVPSTIAWIPDGGWSPGRPSLFRGRPGHWNRSRRRISGW
jgi:hypothetical protein